MSPKKLKELKIVTIGGGTGTPVVNEALLLAGVSHIDSIVTVMDSGGATGRRRTDSRGQEIAYADAARVLLSLIDPTLRDTGQIKALRWLLLNRDERDRVLGYELFNHAHQRLSTPGEQGFAAIQKKLEALLQRKFRGRVIPVTLESTNIVFKTESGEQFEGEHRLDEQRLSADPVTEIWLEPKVAAFSEAVAAVKQADWIIFPFGSLHGSLLVNFLPGGIAAAAKRTKARFLLITNLASTRNETHNFSPDDYIAKFGRYTGRDKPLDVLVVPAMTRQQFEARYPNVAKRYQREYSYFLGWEKKILEKTRSQGVEIVTHAAVVIDQVHHRIRHDLVRLSETFQEILGRGGR